MKVSVIGIGYVGIHSIINLAKSETEYQVVGFDINENKINAYKSGFDVTAEVGNETIQEVNDKVNFTCNSDDLYESDVFIVAVPTDAQDENSLYIRPLESASISVGEHLKHGSIVVYESTVYPGLTEEVCIPILEEKSGLKAGIDFDVVYTPERVDPGNKVNTVLNTPRVISGTRMEAVDTIKTIYEEYITEMVVVSTIKTAESVKILENTQRDINIALMNNFTILMDKLDVDMAEVLEAAATKWNFLNFTPGMVGGHCIGVDPYYLINKMEAENINSTYIKSAREVNEGIVTYIEQKIINSNPENILFVGLTFKPGTNDIRNSKNIELKDRLQTAFNVDVYDPVADTDESIESVDISKYDTIINAVVHKEADYSFFEDVCEHQVFNLVKGYKICDNQWNLI